MACCKKVEQSTQENYCEFCGTPKKCVSSIVLINRGTRRALRVGAAKKAHAASERFIDDLDFRSHMNGPVTSGVFSRAGQ